MYDRMLLTNDGSDLAEVATARAAGLARAMGSQVVVMRVSRAAGEDPERLAPETWAASIARRGVDPGDGRPEAHPPLSETVAVLRDAGVEEAGTLVVQGDPAEAIVEAAERLAADLVVVSSHGASGIRRAVLGSVADHVIRHSPGIPVLLARPFEGDAGYRRILVALDGSELSDALVPHAVAIAVATGAEVVLVRVTDSVFEILTMSTPAGYAVPAGITGEAAEELVRAQHVETEEYLASVATRLRDAGVTSVVERVAEGRPGPAIVAAAEETGSDLVLLATHGRGGLGRALLGSVTDHVVRHLSGAAALVVPPARK